MLRFLLLSVRFHDGRFHGRPEWPPSPARLFQALVAAAAEGVMLHDEDKIALAWLEGLGPPIIAAPSARATNGFSNFVPNNDLDAVAGDVRRIGKIKAAKLIKPVLFDAAAPILYVWRFDDGETQAARVQAIAHRLYQLGRGVDMAFAAAEALDADEAEDRLIQYPGALYRPSGAGTQRGSGVTLACPGPGSLASLIGRHSATCRRFNDIRVPAPTKKNPAAEKIVGQSFTQPPKARFRQVAYDSPPHRLLFELRRTSQEGDFFPWPLTGIVRLVETARDGAAKALSSALPEKAACAERVFIGRDATEVDKASRIRIIPLPSIGHTHADRAIRRLIVEVPPDCPFGARDAAWAFNASSPHDPQTGEVCARLIEVGGDAGDRYADMPRHYGIGSDRAYRVWRTVTPAALPERAARRRIDPHRRREQAKGGAERFAEEGCAASAVRNALRHVDIREPVEEIRVQRDPFHAKDARAEAFATGTRFTKHRLWHVEIAFATPRRGPIAIGDGRYLGLGLMAPVTQRFLRAAVFPMEGEAPPAAATNEVLAALRRALMSLDRDLDEHGVVSTLFSGHKPDGSPAGDGTHRHVFLAASTDESGAGLNSLYVIRPDVVDRSRRLAAAEKARFERVVSALRHVRAGAAGVLNLGRPAEPAAGDPLFAPTTIWESRTVYRPTRHAGRGRGAAAAVIHDALTECARRGLPEPEAEILDLSVGPHGGNLAARLRLRFRVAVRGPILLGRDSHEGGGLFTAAHVEDRAPMPPRRL